MTSFQESYLSKLKVGDVIFLKDPIVKMGKFISSTNGWMMLVSEGSTVVQLFSLNALVFPQEPEKPKARPGIRYKDIEGRIYIGTVEGKLLFSNDVQHKYEFSNELTVHPDDRHL